MRLRRFRKEAGKEGKYPYLVFDLNNIRYLIGFTGTYGILIVDESRAFFISDSRYEEYARSMLHSSVRFVPQKDDQYETIKSLADEQNWKELYLEEHSVPLSVYSSLKKSMPGVKLRRGGDPVNEVRMVKDYSELRVLRQAARITDGCVEHLKKFIRPGMREWDVASEIESFYRSSGCSGSSFETIVASGPGSSMPHYRTSMKKKIEKGDVLLIDMGCVYQGYNSDLTRTFFTGTVDPEIEKIYGIVREAQELAVNAVRPGMTTGELDAVARDHISRSGFGDYFGHSLGHGIGIEVHEIPAVKKGDTELKKDMVITIEPGIYLPGKGGVRIEDMVRVTSRGREVLTKSSRAITVI